MPVKSNYILLSLLGLFILWAGCAAFGVLGQRKLFFEDGRQLLSDFWMPRMCLEQGYVGHPEKYAGLTGVLDGTPIKIDERDVVESRWYTDGQTERFVTGWMDKVYPKITLFPFALFPASWGGAWTWTILAGAFYLLVLCFVAKSWKPLLLAMSMPFLFNLERGNPVWLSAACVAVFLAWWDDECEWKSLVAAVCLGIAGAMKIAPCALGILYFTKWRWKPVLLSAGLALVLMFVPWFFDSDGFAALAAMVRNAKEHSNFVLRAADIGLVEIWRTVRVVLGQFVNEPWPGMMIVARLSQLLGALALILGARRRDYLLLVGGMLLAAGNMYYYAMLYMLPVFVLEWIGVEKGSRLCQGYGGQAVVRSQWSVYTEALLWLALLSPLQLVLLGHSCNQFIGNACLLSLMLLRTVCPCQLTKSAIASNRIERKE